MIGDWKDQVPAEIADGMYLPFTRYEGFTTLGPLKVTIHVKIVNRRPICERLEVESRDGTPVTASSLRDIPVAAMIRKSLEMFEPFRLEGGRRVPVPAQRTVDTLANERQGRKSRDELLPRVVEAYRAALASPLTRDRATQAVADQLGYQRGYISRLLSDARKMDPPLLGPAKRGKSGEWAE